MLKIALPLFFTALLMAGGPVLKTGQTMVYKTGDDGTYQSGTARSYSRSAAGVVTDNATGLEWQDDAVSIRMKWSVAGTYCTNLALDGGGWRLPSIEELVSITDKSRTNPSIDPIFQNVPSYTYWSSTTDASDSSVVWLVDFFIGIDYWYSKIGSYNVRCVRSGA
jgi:hypothetical protein